MLYCDCGESIVTNDPDPGFQAEILMGSNLYVVIRKNVGSFSAGVEGHFEVLKVGLVTIECRQDVGRSDRPVNEYYIFTVIDEDGYQYKVYPIDCYYLERNAQQEVEKRNQEIEQFSNFMKNSFSPEAIDAISKILTEEIYYFSEINLSKPAIQDIFTNYGNEAFECLKNRLFFYADMHPLYWNLQE